MAIVLTVPSSGATEWQASWWQMMVMSLWRIKLLNAVNCQNGTKN